jgi:hypothetical protein
MDGPVVRFVVSANLRGEMPLQMPIMAGQLRCRKSAKSSIGGTRVTPMIPSRREQDRRAIHNQTKAINGGLDFFLPLSK